jgi:ribokinase
MPKAIVVGSINMDIVAFVERQPRPGETIFGKEVKYFPGGKGANQAVACARLGCRTALIGRVGADEFGSAMVRFLDGEGIDTSGIAALNQSATGTAFITVDAASQNAIIVISGANGAWDAAGPILPDASAADIVIAQFEVPDAVILSAFGEARRAGARTILNPSPVRPCHADLLAATDILVVNEIELQQLSGKDIDIASDEPVFDAASALLTAGPRTIVVTLGARGVRVLDEGLRHRIEARPVAPVDTTGAGDCFIGGLAAGLLSGRSIVEAAALGNEAAALSVTREGAAASFPRLAEVTGISGLWR